MIDGISLEFRKPAKKEKTIKSQCKNKIYFKELYVLITVTHKEYLIFYFS